MSPRPAGRRVASGHNSRRGEHDESSASGIREEWVDGAQGVAGRGEGDDPSAGQAQRQAARAADGAGSTRSTSSRDRNGKATLLDLFEGRRQLDRRALHVRPELGGRLPELHGRSRRGVGGSDGPSPHTRHHAGVRLTRADRQDRALQGASGVGPFPGTLRSGSDFNYDFHVTLDESVAPIEYNFRTKAEHAERGVDFRGRRVVEKPGRSHFLRDGDTDLPHVLGVRARASSRSAVRTTCSTRPRSAARRSGRSRRAVPPTHEVPCPTSRPERSGQPGPVTCTRSHRR